MAGAAHGSRRRRRKEREGSRTRRRPQPQQRDWSDLPNLALFSILQRLATFKDRFAFDGVCRAWRAVSRPTLGGFLSSQRPLLCGTGGHHFCGFSRGPSYRSTLRGLCRQDATLLGFSHGYLIMANVGSRREIWLVNPFTGHEVFSIPRVHCAHSPEWAALTEPPSSPRCRLVAWCRLTIVYCNPSDLYWSMYCCETEEERTCSRWPSVLGGAVCARSLSGKLLRFEFYPQPRVTRMGVRHLLPGSTNVWLAAASGGEILAIHANPWLEAAEGCVVYRLDTSRGDWVRMETLGGRALLFTTVGFALCDEHPHRWGGEDNCVYYQRHLGGEVKVFHMEGSRTETLQVNHPSSHLEGKCCCLSRCCTSSFIWVLPGLCY
ncbi:hypothetical protein Taro_008257 [Colocasia esculenta]|uniref:KIB1-4 beta-propeller domain-containing protein n=1 Tax=Colocasia esculenta TaxID=4460 RepID=A0A843U0M6_COLES|nr:hypothetical protein [Colocasia esculenta]